MALPQRLPLLYSQQATKTARFRVPHTIGLCRPGALANQPQAGCWTVGTGSVDVMLPGSTPAQAGTQYLDLNGTNKGQIIQQVPASAGLAYELTFFGRSSRNQAMTVAMAIYWYNASGSLIRTAPFLQVQTGSGAWTKFRLEDVSPTGTAYARVYLTSLTQPLAPNAGFGPLVDNVVFRRL
jgi:hypothetical protein